MLYQIAYGLVKAYTSICLFLFFDKIEVFGREKIPEGPVIFTPNHQNAFIDGIITSCLGRKNVSFLARADVFKVKSLAPILKFFKIIPVYRPRDGSGEMSKNYSSFEMVKEHLNYGHSILIFPEGNQKFFRFLRNLKKGVFRIVQLCETNAEIPKIVPVGISYEHHTKTGFNLILKFGDAIHPTFPLSKGFVKEKEILYQSIYPLMQQIPDYDFQCLSESAWLSKSSFESKNLEKEVTWLKHQYSDHFRRDLSRWKELSQKHGLLPYYPEMNWSSWIKFLIVSVVYLPIVPYRFIVKRIITGITTHKSFRLSLSFALSIFLAPLYCLFVFYFFSIFFKPIYFIGIILCFILFAKNKRVLEQFAFHWRKGHIKKRYPADSKEIDILTQRLKKELVQLQ